MSKNGFRDELWNINGNLKRLVEKIEEFYELKKECDYQINTNQKTFHGFYKGIKIHVSAWTGIVNIWLSFHNSKKDGTKSKTTTGCFVSDVINIMKLPF